MRSRGRQSSRVSDKRLGKHSKRTSTKGTNKGSVREFAKKNAIAKDPRIRKLRRKGKIRGDVISDIKVSMVKKQVLSGLNKKQRKQWNRLSPKEQQKLLASVEKRVQKKLKKDTTVRRTKTVKKDSVTGRYKQKRAVERVRTEKNTVYTSQQRGKNKSRKVSVQTQRENGQKSKERYLHDQQIKTTENKSKKGNQPTQRNGSYKQRYQKEFNKEMRKVSAKQTKAFRVEFARSLDYVSKQVKEKDSAQKGIQKEKTFEEISKGKLGSSVRTAALPVSLPLKWKVEKLMMNIASAIGGAIASIVSAVFPIVAVVAAVFGVISMITGFFGTLAASWDPASPGLPDPAYVANTTLQWAEYIAKNDEHGYNDGFFSRWGPEDYSNVTFVVTAYDMSGLSLKKDGAKSLKGLEEACLANGFRDITDEVHGRGDLKKGDLLIKNGSVPRIAIYCGNGKVVSAICDEHGNQKHGQPGDQTGKEICIESYSGGWSKIYRYEGDMTLYGGIGQELAEYAKSFAGKLPYIYGGASLTSGADCSGFTMAVYAHFGYNIPRTAGNQYAGGKKVGKDPDKWQPGDLIYYSETGSVQTEGGVNEHVAIYIGGGQVVEECSPGIGCRIVNWNYRSDCLGAARYLPTYDGSTTLVGNDNAQKIWNYMRRTLGCSRAAAAGILGNIYAESEFNPSALEPNGVGHGIIQWSWDRWYGADGLQRFASSHGRNWQDLALQLAFFKHEAIENNSMAAYFPGGFQKYKTITSVEGDGGAAHVFFYSFEYGGYVSYATFLSDEFEMNFATRTKRLAISRSVYNDRTRYP